MEHLCALAHTLAVAQPALGVSCVRVPDKYDSATRAYRFFCARPRRMPITCSAWEPHAHPMRMPSSKHPSKVMEDSRRIGTDPDNSGITASGRINVVLGGVSAHAHVPDMSSCRLKDLEKARLHGEGLHSSKPLNKPKWCQCALHKTRPVWKAVKGTGTCPDSARSYNDGRTPTLGKV